jgi:WD40 repeat protein
MDGTLRLWDARAGQELRRFEGHAAILSVACGPDGRHALTGGDHHAVRVWRLPG